MPLRTTATWVAPDQAERRIADATLACVARYGLGKTTIDDVASEAGCSRATLYRYIRGKRQLVALTVRLEVTRVMEAVADAVARAADLEDALVAAVVTAAAEFTGHAALQFVLAHEPELILPHLTFAAGDTVLVEAATVSAPLLERFLPPPAAARLAEWVCRLVLSYSCNPSPGLRLTDPDDVRRLVQHHVLAGVDAAAN